MPVFDFSNVSNTEKEAECTYTTFQSNEPEATSEMPILILDNQKQKWPHHSCGFFTNPNQRTSFEFQEEEGNPTGDILQMDSRFVSLIRWLGEHHINVRIPGENQRKRLCSV